MKFSQHVPPGLAVAVSFLGAAAMTQLNRRLFWKGRPQDRLVRGVVIAFLLVSALGFAGWLLSLVV